MFFAKRANKILLFIIIVLLINVLFVNTAHMYDVIPGDLKITEIMSNMEIRWIEVANNSKHDVDISGFQITTGEDFYLYPSEGNNPFIIPSGYIFLFTNNIEKLQDQVPLDIPVVMIEIADLSMHPNRGSVILKDQFGVTIDEMIYKDASTIFEDGYSMEKTVVSSPSQNTSLPSIEIGGSPGEIFNLTQRNNEGTTYEQNNNDLTMTSGLVDNIESSSATVYWITPIMAQSVLKYGTTPYVLDKVMTEDNMKFFHVIKLTNLNPDTTYYYQTISKSGDVERKSDIVEKFKTKKEKNSVTYRPSLSTQNINQTYDLFDKHFLGLVFEEKAENSDTGIKPSINNTDEVNDNTEGDVGITGYSVALVFAISFVLLIVIKFYLRNKRSLDFNYN